MADQLIASTPPTRPLVVWGVAAAAAFLVSFATIEKFASSQKQQLPGIEELVENVGAGLVNISIENDQLKSAFQQITEIAAQIPATTANTTQIQQIKTLAAQSISTSESVDRELQSVDDTIIDWRNQVVSQQETEITRFVRLFGFINQAAARTHHKPKVPTGSSSAQVKVTPNTTQSPAARVSPRELIYLSWVTGPLVFFIGFVLIILSKYLRIPGLGSSGLDIIKASVGYGFGVAASFAELGLHG